MLEKTLSLVEVQQVTFQPQTALLPNARYCISLIVPIVMTSHVVVHPPLKSAVLRLRSAGDAGGRVPCVPNSTLHELVFTVMLGEPEDVSTSRDMTNITLSLRLWRCDDNASNNVLVGTSYSSVHSSSHSSAPAFDGSHRNILDRGPGQVESWELIAEGKVHAADYGIQRVPLNIIDAGEGEFAQVTVYATVFVKPLLLHEESDATQSTAFPVSHLASGTGDGTEEVLPLLTHTVPAAQGAESTLDTGDCNLPLRSGDSGHRVAGGDKHSHTSSSSSSSSSSSLALLSTPPTSLILSSKENSIEKLPVSQSSLMPTTLMHITRPDPGPRERLSEQDLAPGQESELAAKSPLAKMEAEDDTVSPFSLHAVEVCDARTTTTTRTVSKNELTPGVATLTDNDVLTEKREKIIYPLHATEEKLVAEVSKNTQKDDKKEMEEQPIVPPMEILPSVAPPARWLLYVDLPPLSSSPPLTTAEEVEEEQEGGRDELGREGQFAKALFVSHRDSKREWRLTLCDAEQRRQCVGSPFRTGAHGWSDILVAIGDDIAACTVVALRLEVKDSEGIWMSTGITSKLLPVSTLLAASSKPNVPHRSVSLRGETGWPCIHVRVHLCRVPGTYDVGRALQSPFKCLGQEDLRMHAKREIDGMCSIALRCSVVVLQQLRPHVEHDSVLPFIALTITGGCEQILHNLSKEADSFTNEAFRAPVARFDVFVHAKLDAAHPLLLLTVCSPVAAEIVYGRAVLEPLTLQHTTGHVWLPLHNDYSTCDELEFHYLRGDEEDSAPVVGWIHCSYDYILVPSAEIDEESAGSMADRDLLQWPLLVHSPLNLPKYLASPGLAEAHRWNRMDLSILAATGLVAGEVKARVLPSLRANERCAGSIGSSLLATKTTDIHWRGSGVLFVSAETTHLIVQSFCDNDSKRTGVVDIPRVASSRFWTTMTGEAWLPVLAAPFEKRATPYRGALLFRWTFSSAPCFPTAGVGLGLRGNLGQWLSTERTRPLGTDWFQLECVELTWLWLLHEPPHRPFLRLAAGDFAHELALVPNGPGRLSCAHTTVCLPRANRIDVRVCQYASESGTNEVLGLGELHLSLDEARELLVYDEPRVAAVRVTGALQNAECGLLTARLCAMRVAVRRESQWAFPAPPKAAALELRLGRVLTLQEQRLAKEYLTKGGERDPEGTAHWAVAVMERKADETIQHAPVALESNVLYLRWPVVPLAACAPWQPPPPSLEILLVHNGEAVGSITMDLSCCFGEATGAEMWALHPPDSPAGCSGTTGFVELHYAHNFVDAVVPYTKTGSVADTTGAILFIELVEVRYREEWTRYSVDHGVPRTSLVVGVECESWGTSALDGLTSHFACRMIFYPNAPHETVEVRLQMLIKSQNAASDDADEISGNAVLRIDRMDDSAPSAECGGACWVSVHEASGLRALIGEVRLRWLWLRGSLADRWDRVAPLTIKGSPFDNRANAEWKKTDGVDTGVFPDGDNSGNVDKGSQLPAPVYVSLQVLELTALTPPAETDTDAGTALYIALFADARDGWRGDRTSPVALRAGTHRCAWMQRCLLPFPPRRDAFNVRVELHRCRRRCDDTNANTNANASAAAPVVACGTICIDTPLSCGLLAVPLFAPDGPVAAAAAAVGGASAQWALTIAVAESGLHSTQAMVSARLDEPSATSATGAMGTMGAPAQWMILRICVTAVELHGERGGASWSLDLRTEAPLIDASQHTPLSLVDKEDNEKGVLEWSAVLCVGNPCTLRLHAMTGKVEGVASLTLCHVPAAGEANAFRHTVEMREVNGSIPIGRVRTVSQVLACSSELYDPRVVFFKRVLCVEVRELIGVVRTLVGRRQQSRRHPRHFIKSKKTGGRIFVRLQDGKWTLDSASFPPTPVHVRRENLHSERSEDDDDDDRKKQEKNDNDQSEDGIPTRVAPKSALLFARVPAAPIGPAQLCLSLHLTRIEGREEGICIGETTLSVEDSIRDDNIIETGAVTQWIPIPSKIFIGLEKMAQDEKNDTPQRAYALVRHAWSYHVSIGRCIVCVRVRSLGHTSLRRPFLCFLMRFPNGQCCRLPLHLFRSGLSMKKQRDNALQLCDSFEVANTSAAVWSFAFIRLPVVGPLGAQLQYVELHDQVTPDVTIHVGTHKWSDVDTATLFINHDEHSSFPERERWLRFGEEGDSHEILIASSPHFPLESSRQKQEGHSVVGFHWEPVSATVPLAADVAVLGAAGLTVQCGMHIGRCYEDGDWEWSESALRADVATCISIGSFNAELHATWAAEAFLGNAFAQQIDVDELRSGLVRYAVRARITVSRFNSTDTIPSEPTVPLFAVQSEVFILDSRCFSTSGSVNLPLEFGSTGNFAMRWRITYEDTLLKESPLSKRAQTDGESAAWPAVLLNSNTVHDREHRLDDEGEEEEDEEKEEESKGRARDVTQLDLYRSFPHWMVTSLDARGLPVVCDSPPPLQDCVPVMAHLAAVPRRRIMKKKNNDNDNDNDTGTRARRPLRSGAVYFPVAFGTASGAAPHALRIDPEWRVGPNLWADPRRPLRLTLWQVLSRGLTYPLGAIRLDTVLRDTFAQRNSATAAAAAAVAVATTPWRQLRGTRGAAEMRFTLQMDETTDAQPQRMSSLPLSLFSPLTPPLCEAEVPVCVELRDVSILFAAQSSLPPPALGLVLSPAGNKAYALCSSTRLSASGPACAAHGFVLKRRRTARDDNNNNTSGSSGGGEWLALDVMLVECRGDGEMQIGPGIAREDIVRVVSVTRVDVRDVARGPTALAPHGLSLGDPSLCVTLRLCAVAAARPVPRLAAEGALCHTLALRCFAGDCGEDTALRRVGGALCGAGMKLYWAADDGVAVWDATALCRALSHGAVSFAVPRVCFHWTVGKRPSTRESCALRRVGQAVWACDPLRVMVEGGVQIGNHAVSSGLSTWTRAHARVSESMTDAEVVGVVRCYDAISGVWDVLRTNGLERTRHPRRAFHTAVVMDARVWCYGGFCLDGEDENEEEKRAEASPRLSGELTCMDMATRQWITVEPVVCPNNPTGPIPTLPPDLALAPALAPSPAPQSHSLPPPLACHTAVAAGGQMYLFGGLRETGPDRALMPSDGLFVLHAVRLEWTEVTHSGVNWPAARFAHAAAAVPGDARGLFIVFGGATRVGAVGAAACAREEMLWAFYPDMKCWRRICVSPAVPLTQRVLSVMAIIPLTEDPVTFTAVVAGGCHAHDVEEKIRGGMSASPIPVAEESNVTNMVHSSSTNVEKLLSLFISAVGTAPSCGTVWISLREDVM